MRSPGSRFGGWTNALPEAEQNDGKAIAQNLDALRRCVEEFGSALEIFDHAEIIPPEPIRENVGDEDYPALKADFKARFLSLVRWQLLAARSGALSIYEFHRIEQAIDLLVSRCPTIKSQIDKNARSEAAKIFAESFPHFADVRVAAAHGHELNATPEKADRNCMATTRVPGLVNGDTESQVLISDAMLGRKYINTLSGKIVSYELSKRNHTNLELVLSLRILMFFDIMKELERKFFSGGCKKNE